MKEVDDEYWRLVVDYLEDSENWDELERVKRVRAEAETSSEDAEE